MAAAKEGKTLHRVQRAGETGGGWLIDEKYS